MTNGKTNGTLLLELLIVVFIGMMLTAFFFKGLHRNMEHSIERLNAIEQSERIRESKFEEILKED